MSFLDRHFPDRAKPGEPMFTLAICMVVTGVLQVATGAFLIFHR